MITSLALDSYIISTHNKFCVAHVKIGETRNNAEKDENLLTVMI